MLREDKHISSHRPYLLQPSSLRIEAEGGHVRNGSVTRHAIVDAMWFRRKNGKLQVSIGVLSAWIVGTTFEDFVKEFRYGRYGGTPYANWDGEHLWTSERATEFVHGRLLSVLRPALTNFPHVNGKVWQGWYDIREIHNGQV